MTTQHTKEEVRHADHKPAITATQLLATALASVTAAVLGSFIGTAGTIVGAGLASVITTGSGAIYQRSLDRTRSRLRTNTSQARLAAQVTEPMRPVQRGVATRTTQLIRPVGPPSKPARGLRNWRSAALLTTLAFVLGIGAVTGFELLKGGPISGGDNGTTVGSLFGQPTEHPTTGTAPPPSSSTTPAPTTTNAPATTTRPPTTTTQPPTTTSPPATTQPPTTTPSLPGQTGQQG
jgi:hypothetical protein